MTNNNQNLAMGWNDTITEDGAKFVVLPEGDYNFVVSKFERGRYAGGPKIPACNMAKLVLKVDSDEGNANVNVNLLLYRTMEWKVSSFFRSLSLKKSGEPLVMDWSKVEGAKGRGHFKPDTYTGNDGRVHDKNELDYFIDFDPEFFPEDMPDAELPF